MGIGTVAPAVNSVPLRKDAGIIGLVGLAHLLSHFSQLMIAPLFPWLRDDFSLSYAELGLLITIFYIVSGVVQALAGFVVDRVGPAPVLMAGLLTLGLAAIGLAASPNYVVLLLFSALAGAGNGVFHPADYTLLTRKVSPARLSHGYSTHGITGSLGWAIAPMLLVPLTLAFSWRVALLAAAGLIFLVLAVIWLQRARLQTAPPAATSAGSAADAGDTSRFGFLAIPALWMCFAFFLAQAVSISGMHTFAAEAARQLHDVSLQYVAMCLSIFLVSNAVGMAAGGFLSSNPNRAERVIAQAYGFSALIALFIGFGSLPGIAVPFLFGVIGLCVGSAGPARDLLVKRSAPANATGRVFGVVYSGLDAGLAIGPLMFGLMMDWKQPALVWLGIALLQIALITMGLNFNKVRRTRHVISAGTAAGPV